MQINYQATPTCSKFHADDSFVRGLRGPVGSGKSVACVIEMLQRACRQEPNGFKERKTRWAIIRNTFPELKTTAIKTFEDWIPGKICPIKYDSPIRGNLTLPLPDKTTVKAEFLFLALDKPKDVQKLLSLELTGAWANEARELDKTVIDGLTMRVGRYPSMRDGGCTWSGIIMDTNPPDDDHWWYDFECIETPDKWRFFAQPPAILKIGDRYVPNRGQGQHPIAENVEHHSKGYDYYMDMIAGKDPNWIASYCMNQFATLVDGRPIYEHQFNEVMHVSTDELWPQKGLPVYIGFDFGLTPSAIFGQINTIGQLRIIDELVSESMGIDTFVRETVMPLIKNKYRDNELIVVGDPAGVSRSDTDERTAFDVLNAYGMDAIPATSNNPARRWEAVRSFLTRLVDGGKPAFLLNRSCKSLRKGFLSGYRFKRLQVSGEEKYSERADKNKFSHPHDALQYLCLAVISEQDEPMVSGPEYTAIDTVTGY